MPMHTTKSKAFKDLRPDQIRQRCRELSRFENGLPNVKWANFQEQHRTEERASIRFEQKLAGVGEFRRGERNPLVDRIIGRIQRAVDHQMKEKGGTAYSIIRSTFLNWDSDASGSMSDNEVMGALRMLKLRPSQEECDALVHFYDIDASGEMKYQTLVEDITRVSPHFLDHPNTNRLQQEKAAESSRKGGNPLVTARKEMPRIVELFISKLKRNLKRIMREKGGTEHSILRYNFLNWDADKSGEVGPRELQGCVHTLALKLSDAEAKAIVDYYDSHGSGEMRYQPLVEDVVRNSGHFLVYPPTERKKAAEAPTMNLEEIERKQDEDALFSARPRRRPPNAVVEAFKARLKNKLEIQLRASGGTIYSICRENFLIWDGNCDGKLSLKEFVGALKKMSVEVSDEDSKQICKFYDLTDCGEMSYMELVKDILQGVPHFMTHETARGSARPEVATEAVRNIEKKIRDASNQSATKAITRLSGEELFYGTCIRFDSEGKMRLGKSDLDRVFREVNCRLSDVELKHLLAWYDVGGEDRVVYKDLVRSVFSQQLPAMQSQALVQTSRSMLPSVQAKPQARTMDFKSEEMTARGKRAGVLAEKARIEQKIKDIVQKERALKAKATGRSEV